MSRQDRLSCRDKTDKTRQTVFVSCRIACLSVLSRQNSLSCRDKTYKTVACRVCLVTTRQDRQDSLLRQETGKTRQTDFLSRRDKTDKTVYCDKRQARHDRQDRLSCRDKSLVATGCQKTDKTACCDKTDKTRQTRQTVMTVCLVCRVLTVLSRASIMPAFRLQSIGD